MLWFNLPYSKNSKINVGRKYLDLVRSCFPPTNKLHKFLNTNTLKISYRCMPNMAKILSSHNVKLLDEANTPATNVENIPTNTPVTNVENIPIKTCNCRNKETCPLSGKCLSKNLIYQATVTSTDNGQIVENKYIGLTSTTIKERIANHRTDMKYATKRKSTSLSEFIWKLKDKNTLYDIKWKIMEHANPFCEGVRNVSCVLWKNIL